MLTDTHAHLDRHEFGGELEVILAAARDAGVSRIVTIGIDNATSRAAVALAEKYPFVWATVGVHPHDAAAEVDWEELGRLARHPRVVAIGECGLDYYRDLSPRDAQDVVFRRQIALAGEVAKPLVIHCRDAHADVTRILREGATRPRRGVMHCFSGDVAQANAYREMGFVISLAGPVTYPNAPKLKEVARTLPLTEFVLETDCPWLAPQAKRGKRNEPAYVRYTAAEVAALRGISIEEGARATSETAARLFEFPA